MPSAYALGIVSGNSILDFGAAERLRALRCSFFTGGLEMGNGSCSAASCGSAALRTFPTIAARNKKAIVFASLHQRWLRIGAADEARTRYLHLGKVALYQMSYGRILHVASRACLPATSIIIPHPSRIVNHKFAFFEKIFYFSKFPHSIVQSLSRPLLPAGRAASSLPWHTRRKLICFLQALLL